MKKWSPKWKSSKTPKKQRKYRYNAPLHIKRKFINVHLSPELRKKYKKRSMPVRKGDEVIVLRGKHKKKTGKVSRVDLKKTKVYVEGIIKKKVAGTEVQDPLQPSNLMITSLQDDKKRFKKSK